MTPTVVVVGAGIGGLAVAKGLRARPVRTVLVDRNNYQLFAPLLYQVSTALLETSDIAEPVRALVRRVPNAEFRQARVETVDLDGRRVVTDHGTLDYDYLVVAAGSQTNFFGNTTVEAHSVGMKELPDALALRNEILARFETAKWTDDPEERRRLLSFFVVGGGPTGVETAGALAELIHQVQRRDYRTFDPSLISVSLLERGDHLLTPFHEKLREAARVRLERMGVRVMLETGVAEMDEHSVTLEGGEVLPAGLVVWAAGVRGSDLGAMLTPELARGGRVTVTPSLQLPDRPEVFVVGDLAEIAQPGEERPLPMLGSVALQSGAHAAKNIAAAVGGGAVAPFRYKDKGIMATIGRNAAVVQVRGLRVKGFPAWVMWMAVHLLLIVSFRNNVRILWNWLWNWLRHERPARIILDLDRLSEDYAHVRHDPREEVHAPPADEAAVAKAHEAAESAAREAPA